MDDLVSAMSDVFTDTAEEAMAQVGVGAVDDDLFEQINDRAVEWAKDNAAELVTGVSETTRDDIREAISDGLADGLDVGEIADGLAEIGSFDDDRADLIAETEVARANSQGALDGYRQAGEAGVHVMKEWLIASENVCDDCQDASDQGPIELDEVFDSVDEDAPPGHPNCRCALAPVVINDDEDEDDDSEKIAKPRRRQMVCN